MKNLDIIENYVNAAAPSGFEEQAFHVMYDHLNGHADSIIKDNLGSLIASKKGTSEGPKILLAGHLDEIGFLVTHIDVNGYIYFQTLGGWWSQVMLAQQVDVVNSKNIRYTGVIGAKPPHMLTQEERNKTVEISTMFIDLGVSNKDEVLALGIKPGDFVVPKCQFQTMSNEKYLLAKAFDNRIGCYIASEVMIRLKNEKHDNILYTVGNVQEEVGLRGAKTTVNVVKPDLGFSVDVGIATDMPGLENIKVKGELGKGPLITIFDASMIAHRGLRDFVIDVADENNIPFQYASLAGGGTDAGAIHTALEGVPSLSIAIATRYIHSNVSIVHYDDVEYCIELLINIVKKVNNDNLNEIKSI